MKFKRLVLGFVAAVFGLPVLAIVIAVVWIHLLNRGNSAIVVSGERREYLLHVPPNYDPARPTPLVISLHGAAGWPSQQMHLSRWNRVADAEGFLVLYPRGSDVPSIWQVERGAGLLQDVRFISALIDTVEAAYNVDPSRIYANGISNGGGMAFVLSCTLSDRIAAVGLVAAAQTLPFSWCTDRRPIPMIAFHGTADPIVPYLGGPMGDRFNPADVTFPAARVWVADWARRNRCDPTPSDSAVNVDVLKRAYPGCADDAAVVLYTIEGGGHAWPGGKPLPAWWVGPTSDRIDATREMWAFFQAHRLPVH